jgi:hypothetical protein
MLLIYFVCMQFYITFVLKCSWNLFISGCATYLSYRNLDKIKKKTVTDKQRSYASFLSQTLTTYLCK